jgi:5'(3')-deoxyribonucleotidase
MEKRKIVYVDMDNVLVDFPTGIQQLSEETKHAYEDRLDEVPGIFSLMDPIPGAYDAVHKLAEYYDLYVLSTAPWKNPSAWTDKAKWIQRYFGEGNDSLFYKRLIISHHKNLNNGDYLIDDREKNGAKEFSGELILFGSEAFPGWQQVTEYLLGKPGIMR